MEVYLMPKDKRKSIGKAGYEWATSDEAGFTSEQMASKVVIKIWKNYFQHGTTNTL